MTQNKPVHCGLCNNYIKIKIVLNYHNNTVQFDLTCCCMMLLHLSMLNWIRVYCGIYLASKSCQKAMCIHDKYFKGNDMQVILLLFSLKCNICEIIYITPTFVSNLERNFLQCLL